MKISIIEKTTDYRGDHSADVSKAHEYIEGEKVENLIERCLLGTGEFDHIELRVIPPVEEKKAL